MSSDIKQAARSQTNHAYPIMSVDPYAGDRRPQERSRKELGQYYTPQQAADILCSWAIRRPEDIVLEPSFGACGFLEAAIQNLRKLGSNRPQANLYGCDIDSKAFYEYLKPKLGINPANGHFLQRDFLDVCLPDFDVFGFDSIVGNPPYVSYHNMSEETRFSTEQVAVKDGFKLTPKASLWAFFIMHGITFLRPGGCMAWVLPSSFLFAEYATTVKDYVAQHFERCLIVQLRQRLFLDEGTEELTAILLADGRREKGGEAVTVNLDLADTLSDLREIISAWDRGEGKTRPMNGRIGTAFLSRREKESMYAVTDAGDVFCLGDIADIRIGIVTGANPFFVINQSKARAYELSDDCLSPILAKFSIAPSTLLVPDDLENARRKDFRCLLVNSDHPEVNERGSSLRRYLATMPRSKRRSNRTFKKRTLWHRPDDGRIPDAFFPYMYQHGPRIILNDAGVTSTNTIHRLYFKDENRRSTAVRCNGISAMAWKKACAISILSTFSQLSGELQGRCYGAGVLKHEPSEASRIRLVIPNLLHEEHVNAVFQQVDDVLRGGDANEARRIADLFVLQELTPVERETIIAMLAQALDEARRRRRRSPNDRSTTK